MSKRKRKVKEADKFWSAEVKIRARKDGYRPLGAVSEELVPCIGGMESYFQVYSGLLESWVCYRYHHGVLRRVAQ